MQVVGSLTGEFFGLNDSALIGNFGGRDLFITYAGGDGNDVVLFTSVPEPGTAGLMGLMMLSMMFKRRRRQSLAA